MTPEEIHEILKSEFDNAIVDFITDLPVEMIICVDPLSILKVSKFLAHDERMMFDSLMNLSGVDDANGEKETAENGDETIKGGTLSVYYHLYSFKHRHKLTLKVSAERENPKVESVESIWKTADWHEREAFDLVGIDFLGHPALKRILMPYDWEEGSHPLRKDYKNPEFYKGMKVPY